MYLCRAKKKDRNPPKPVCLFMLLTFPSPGRAQNYDCFEWILPNKVLLIDSWKKLQNDSESLLFGVVNYHGIDDEQSSSSTIQLMHPEDDTYKEDDT